MANRTSNTYSPGLIQRAKEWLYRLVRRIVLTIATIFIVLVGGLVLLGWLFAPRASKQPIVAETPVSIPAPAPAVAVAVAPAAIVPKPTPEPQPEMVTTTVAPAVTPATVAPATVEPTPAQTSPSDPKSEEPLESDDGVEVVDTVEIDFVRQVIHGDDIWVGQKSGRSQHVKLRGIDAPDSGQKLSKESREALSALLLDKSVEVRWNERDQSTALMADVYLGDEWINLRMVREGWAWYDGFNIQNDELRDAQNEARKAKRGIWSIANPVPPWEYRSTQRDKEATAFARAAEVKEQKGQAEVSKKEQAPTNLTSDDSPPISSSSSGGSVYVKGHYRTSKTGKTYYVSPHTRRK